MISILAQDLVSKIKAVPSNAFGIGSNSRVGLAVGGKATDPLLEKIVKPAAWVIFIGDENVDTREQVRCGSIVRFSFVVKIIMDYKTEAELLSVQFPLLDEVRGTVHGSSSTSGNNWKYEGQTMEELTANRVVFEQRYSLTTPV